MTGFRKTLFELRYLSVALITMPMIVYFAALFWAERNLEGWKRIPVYPFAGIFVVLSFVYNATCGWWIFWRLPRELQFTDRLQKYDQDPELAPYVARFKAVLNESDPGHV